MDKMHTRLEGKIKKGWGYELIWATNEKYCGKIMVFEKIGAKFFNYYKDLYVYVLFLVPRNTIKRNPK